MDAGRDVETADVDGSAILRLGGKRGLFDCCVDLDSASVDTRSNAAETKRWLDRRGYKSVRLVTSDWHMRRARFEFDRTIGDERRMIVDAVPTEPGLRTMFTEYNKYLFRRLGLLAGI